ncbi:cupin domain-containing protein [Mucilaginibacter pineti]|nr:cupin domain-containing protein [Mucilaginibacter pineti]
MMNAKKYIETGNLEQYCLEFFNTVMQQEIATLSLTNPEIKQELNEIEVALEQFAENQAIKPKDSLKEKIFASLGFLSEERLDIDNLPLTHKHSDYAAWLKVVEHLLPAEPFDDFFMNELRQDNGVAQMLIITRMDVPEETHEDIAESFFILKGQCSCTVGEDVFILNEGDYLDIPLCKEHDVKILSPYVIAIVQHQSA